MADPDLISDSWFARASAVIPGGVNSPVRGFGAVGGTPRFIASARGAYLTDVDGRDYVDLVGSWGPMILGHAHPAVVDAIRAAAARGTSFGAATAGEVELAEEVVRRVPPVERLRLVSSGTEATMTALRLARAVTGRSLVLKFAGCYHGHVDALLAAAGSGALTFGLPDSPGVTAATAAETLIAPYNDLDTLHTLFAHRGREIACVITEAAPANMGVVPPCPEFNATLRRLTREHGALLILDEVLTGFRVSPAGWWGHERVTPDLFTFGKVMGGGLPLAGFGGSAALMDQLAPVGPVYQAGTLSGNPLGVAAGLTTLRHCDAALYGRVDEAAATVSALAADALSVAGVAHRINHAGNLFSVFFTDQDVTDYEGARSQSGARYAAFFHAMLDHGVYLPPSGYEAWFLSGAHEQAAIDRIAAALPVAAKAAAAVAP